MKDWLELAKELPLNGKAQTVCPQDCGSGEKLSINHNNQSYWCNCYRCGHTDVEYKGRQTLEEINRIEELNKQTQSIVLDLELPSDYTTGIPLQGRLWLYKAGIHEYTWKKYKIGYSEKLQRVILPVYNKRNQLIWYQCRAIQVGQIPKYIQPAADRSKVMFEALGHNNAKEAILVEDILSCIRVGKHIKTYSLLGTKITTEQASELSKYKLVRTWLDPDEAGVNGASKIRRTLGLVTEVSNITSKVDPKELSDKQIKGIL